MISLVVAFVLIPLTSRGDFVAFRTGEIEKICPSFLFILTEPSRRAKSNSISYFFEKGTIVQIRYIAINQRTSELLSC